MTRLYGFLICLLLLMLSGPGAFSQVTKKMNAPPLHPGLPKPDDQLEAVIPYYYQDGRMTITATLDHHPQPLHFIFDSGDEEMVLDSSWGKRWALTPIGRLPLCGMEDAILRQPVIRAKSLDFGPIHLSNPELFLENLSAFSTQSYRVDGIIGYGLLRNFVVRINRLRSVLEFYRATEKFNYGSAGQLFPLHMSALTPVITGTLDLKGGQRLQGAFHLITGGEYGVFFYFPFVRKYQLQKQLPSLGRQEMEDLDSTIAYHQLSLPFFGIGKYSFHQMPAAYSPKVDDESDGGKIAGAIGNDVLKHFNIIFNYPGKEIFLEPIR
ncbi:MAG: hypothetical protein ACYCOO_02130 [Chitinophagaceae bacterium]